MLVILAKQLDVADLVSSRDVSNPHAFGRTGNVQAL
jgi:hypothetical protein